LAINAARAARDSLEIANSAAAGRLAPQPAPIRTGDGPIDRVHLARQTLGDTALASEVLRMFDEMVGTYFGRLERSTTRNDLMVNLHALKGASMGVGAFRLAELARSAEDELRSGLPVNPERVEDIGMAVEEVRAFIAGMLLNEPA